MGVVDLVDLPSALLNKYKYTYTQTPEYEYCRTVLHSTFIDEQRTLNERNLIASSSSILFFLYFFTVKEKYTPVRPSLCRLILLIPIWLSFFVFVFHVFKMGSNSFHQFFFFFNLWTLSSIFTIISIIAIWLMWLSTRYLLFLFVATPSTTS